MSLPVVFLHGWASSPACWSQLVPYLSGRICHSIALPGYDAEAADWSAPVEELLTRLPAQCHLVGWSLGGNLAMALAAYSPERIASVVTLATVPQFVASSAWPWAMPQATFDAFSGGVDIALAKTLKRFAALQAKGDTKAKVVSRELQTHFGAASHEVLVASLAWLAKVDQVALWQVLKVPHLAVFGANDALVPVAAAQHCRQSLVLADCAHAPMLSQPQQLAALLHDFWQEAL